MMRTTKGTKEEVKEEKKEERKRVIAENFSEIHARLKAQETQGNKSPLLVAVSKTFPLTDIEAAYEFGQRDFGENRVQELQEKASLLDHKGYSDLVWHYLGKIQSNKVKTLFKISHLEFLHSIDSWEILQKLFAAESLLEKERRIGFFLQVNTSGEGEKQGLSGWQQVKEILQWIANQKLDSDGSNNRLESPQGKLYYEGLMTMGSVRGDDYSEDARRSFSKLREINSKVQALFPHLKSRLSMGMSQDYLYALEWGTDVVRIGSSLFGSRASFQAKV